MIQKIKQFMKEFSSNPLSREKRDPNPPKPIEGRFLYNPEHSGANLPGIQRMVKDASPVYTPEQMSVRVTQDLRKAVAAINRQIKKSSRYDGLRFQIHQEIGRWYVSIRDLETGEQLKQIDTAFILELATRLRNASGLLESKKA